MNLHHPPSKIIGMVLFAGVGLLTMLTGTAASQEEPGKEPVLSDPAEDPRLTNQVPLVEAADQLQHISEASGLENFVGVEIDHATYSVNLYWYGDSDVRSRILEEAIERLNSDGIGVKVIRTPYTPIQLDAEAVRITGLDPAQVNGVRVTAAGPTDDYSGLVVSVEPADLPLAEASIKSTFPLHFEAMPMVQPIGRWDDVPPFWAGAGADIYIGGINPQRFEYCTPNFSVFRAGGAEAMIFPRHCRPGNWFTPTSDQFIGSTSSDDAPSVDAYLLRTADYGPAMWTGTWGNSGTGRFVGGQANPSDESFVLVSGSHSGGHTVQVKQVRQYINMPIGDGLTRRIGPGFWTVDQEGDGSAGDGDSGGPVANPNSRGYMIARGMMDTIDSGRIVACEGNTAAGRNCSTRLFNVNIKSILSALDLTIQKI